MLLTVEIRLVISFPLISKSKRNKNHLIVSVHVYGPLLKCSDPRNLYIRILVLNNVS
jgi:predicted N-formylglutamate amidohydrolase